jgi:4-aminobutyrate aminotransferase-like enzyme
MGGGIPLSGVIGKSKIMDLPEIGNMSSTHSANPLACSAGLAVLDEIKSKKLIYESKRKGKILITELEKIKIKFPKIIKYIFGKGLIAAILFKSKNKPDHANLIASKITEYCMRRGLLVVHTGRESIKIGPPLTIPDEALLEGIQVLEDSIKYFYDNEY